MVHSILHAFFEFALPMLVLVLTLACGITGLISAILVFFTIDHNPSWHSATLGKECNHLGKSFVYSVS